MKKFCLSIIFVLFFSFAFCENVNGVKIKKHAFGSKTETTENAGAGLYRNGSDAKKSEDSKVNNDNPKNEKNIEFMLNPEIGLSVLNLPGGAYIAPWHGFSCGFDIGLITENNFTFILSNYFLLGGKTSFYSYNYFDNQNRFSFDPYIYIPKVKVKISKTFWEASAIFGYTKRFKNKFYLQLGAGIGLGFGNPKPILPAGVKWTRTHNILVFNVGVPLHLSLEYFFTNNFGLALAITDTYSFAKQSIWHPRAYYIHGDCNVFQLKIGPAFRF